MFIIKPLATLGIVAVTSALSLCDICAPGTGARAIPTGITSVSVITPQQSVRGVQTVTLAVKGMTCAGCVIGTRTVLKRLPGVTTVDVSYDKGTAVVTYDPARVTVAQMVEAIKTLGYTATPVAAGAVGSARPEYNRVSRAHMITTVAQLRSASAPTLAAKVGVDASLPDPAEACSPDVCAPAPGLIPTAHFRHDLHAGTTSAFDRQYT